MLQSQKLKTIEYLFTSNKEKELSYSKKYIISTEDKITKKYIWLIREKYIWFDILEWVKIYNQKSNVWLFTNLYYKIRWVNLYIDSFINKARWDEFYAWIKLETVFKILDSKLFLNSLLELIDNEKEELFIHKQEEQIKELQNDINKSKGKFDNIKFPLTYNFWKYLSSHTQYYKSLNLLSNQYNIDDIQIYQWKITFTLSLNINKITDVEFNWNEILIDKKSLYFKYMKDWNTTKDLFILSFSYFTKYKVNKVDFDSLEKFYKEHNGQYKWLKTTKFNDEWVRWYIKGKNKKIELDRFMEVTTNWLHCQYYHPER